MDWSWLGQVGAALGALVIAARRWLSAGAAVDSRRHDVHQNLDLLERLPNDSPAREHLAVLIADQVERLIAEAQVEKRRDPRGIVLAMLFIAAAVAVGYRMVAADWWGGWWLLAGSLALVGAVGLSQDLVARERDERGRPIREPKARSGTTGRQAPPPRP